MATRLWNTKYLPGQCKTFSPDQDGQPRSRLCPTSLSYVALPAKRLRQVTSAWNALSIGSTSCWLCRMLSAASVSKPSFIDNWYQTPGILIANSSSSSSEGEPVRGIGTVQCPLTNRLFEIRKSAGRYTMKVNPILMVRGLSAHVSHWAFIRYLTFAVKERLLRFKMSGKTGTSPRCSLVSF